MNTSLQKKQGFTIIEVVLVLAIAALIFLMIFVALPALQRGQRDTARKEDVGTIAAAVNSFRSNNNNRLPTESGDLNNYIDTLSQIDDTDNNIEVTDAVGEGEGGELDTATVYVEATCDGDHAVDGGTSRQAAVVTKLEAGGNEVTYCQGV